jgi:hypothetical protein
MLYDDILKKEAVENVVSFLDEEGSFLTSTQYPSPRVWIGKNVGGVEKLENEIREKLEISDSYQYILSEYKHSDTINLNRVKVSRCVIYSSEEIIEINEKIKIEKNHFVTFEPFPETFEFNISEGERILVFDFYYDQKKEIDATLKDLLS